jgi:hypothetical protein
MFNKFVFNIPSQMFHALSQMNDIYSLLSSPAQHASNPAQTGLLSQ